MTYLSVHESLADKALALLKIATVCDRRIRGIEAGFGNELGAMIAYLESWNTKDQKAFESPESDIFVPSVCQEVLQARDSAGWGSPSMNAVRAEIESEIENLRMVWESRGDLARAKRFTLAAARVAMHYMNNPVLGLAAA